MRAFPFPVCVAVGAILGLLGHSSAGMPDPKPAPESQVDAATVTAFKELGADYSGRKVDQFGELTRVEMSPGTDPPAGSIPVFEFGRLRLGKMPKVPDVAVRFGISLRSTVITDEGLKELAGLKNLVYLDLRGTDVTDAGLQELARLKSLEMLLLGNSRPRHVTDAGLKQLKGLENPSFLDLRQTQITNAGLRRLAALQNLCWLHVGETEVTAAGVTEFRQMLRGCHIFWKPRV